MTTLPPTMLLLACMLAATVLGAGIGACLLHLWLVRRFNDALATGQAVTERERKAFDAMLVQEREMAALKHDQERRNVARERERAERAAARHAALAVHEREQSRRIEVLEAEVLGLEERQMKLQRDLASDRAGRRHGPSQARPIVSRVGDDRLPVLNRRVTAGTSAAASAGAARFPLGGDLEIPALAESELPDTVDELALDELLESAEVDRKRDER